ncbi:hypothetical protein IQ244_06085 [Nostoc sp. LEGE 06077]|uniref:hypothetical protein n=1 Tax=Nostoc sp. LEGE 06077 TaxID=915325 RepID=UPI000B6193E4|nr:hypothetical protein [Nostoc sp. LEGE 06077]MBE9206088.1 hypothetical protein [Nostoc sp. LEGE 06077]PMB05454.1 hypothetical protein CI594_03250 [Fischerella thermalis CCMEE 5196]BAZ19282.1 hypothetical protein NIES4073_01520 [Scytonema sp. NIES-4073]
MSEAERSKSEEEQRKGIPVYADRGEPKINDPALLLSNAAWRGSNEISFKLLRCLEAIRDLSKSMEVLASLNEPGSDKRLVKHLASPLYALVSGVLDMFNELESNAKNYTVIASPQHKEIISRKSQLTASVPIDNKSALRIVRDKIDSHIDKAAVIRPEDYWVNVDLPSFLKWMGICLEQILYLISLDVYGWTRDSGHPDVWSLMSVDGTVVDFYMQDGEPVAIIGITFAKSPKYGVLNEIKSFLKLYNEVARKCQDVNLIEISKIETHDTESEQAE